MSLWQIVGAVAVTALVALWAVCAVCLNLRRKQYLRCPACRAYLRKVCPFLMVARCPGCGRQYEVESTR